MGTEVPGVKRPGCSVDHTTPSSAEFKERVEPYIYAPSGTSWTFIGWNLHLPVSIISLPWPNGHRIPERWSADYWFLWWGYSCEDSHNQLQRFYTQTQQRLKIISTVHIFMQGL